MNPSPAIKHPKVEETPALTLSAGKPTHCCWYQDFEWRAHIKQVFRFGLVSGFCTLIDFIVLTLLVKVMHHGVASVSIALACGYVMSTVTHFFLARRLVFSPTRLPIGWEFALVFSIAMIGLGLTELIALSLIRHFHLQTLPQIYLAKAAAIVVVFFWNFLARRFFIYHHRPHRQAPAE